MTKQKGVFVISLDFELYWGMLDKTTLEEYRENLLGVRSAVPFILRLFDEYGIHATWAVVGFLFFETRDELMKHLPTRRPDYLGRKLSSYSHIYNIGSGEREDPFHFAPSLIKMIASFPHQEIGSHTFSHYYCLERGQDVNTFRDDLEAARKVADRYALNLESLVFPRNQFQSEYISVLREVGIKAYRGNESSWIYSPETDAGNQRLLKRALRLIDAYINLSGHNSYSLERIGRNFPFNIPSSRFLRPYSRWLSFLELVRLRRVVSDLTHAAKNGLVYHLWWHPHNFGKNLQENMSFLRKILESFASLRKAYGMESLNMGELANRLLRQSGDR